MRKLAIDWTKHLEDPDSRKEFEALVRNSTAVLGRFRAILTQHLQSLEAEDTGPEQFKSPAWSHQAAYRMGQMSVYKDLLRYFEFIDR